jgi:twitching motility protein PilT
MAALDKILDAMEAHGARTLLLFAGKIPQFLTETGSIPVLKGPIPEQTLAAYLRELADPRSLPSLDGRRPCSFSYRGYEVSVEFPPEGLRARVQKPGAGAPPFAPSAAAGERDAQPVLRHPIDRLLHEMVRLDASDLHISSGEPPFVRRFGEMVRLEGREALSASAARELLWPVCPEPNRAQYEAEHDTDFAYNIEGLARFRCNYFLDRKGMGGVFRQIPTKVPTVEELGIPAPVVDLCWLSKGLVLVTGPTGSGKSTTLAALIDFVNRNRTDHVITIEDPIEFVHENKRCLLNQREVKSHTESFKRALRAALREDPDIVMVGEMRDLETIAIALETAETGHLVFATLHTATAPSTVDRIIDQFPADRQAQVRVMLSESLKGIISQCLCRKVGGGRICAQEVLLVNSSIANLIREGKTFQIPSIMQTQKAQGNTTLNDSLFALVKAGVVEPKEAYIKSVDKVGLKSLYERHHIALDMGAEKEGP